MSWAKANGNMMESSYCIEQCNLVLLKRKKKLSVLGGCGCRWKLLYSRKLLTSPSQKSPPSSPSNTLLYSKSLSSTLLQYVLHPDAVFFVISTNDKFFLPSRCVKKHASQRLKDPWRHRYFDLWYSRFGWFGLLKVSRWAWCFRCA